MIAVDAIRRFDGGPSGLAGVALARKLGCDVTAVVPDGDVDAASAALAAGAHALVQAGALGVLASDAAPSTESPAAIGAGAGPSGPPSDELPVRFRSRYGAAWADWMEPCLVVLAAGGERTEQAEALDELSGADAAPGGSQQSRRRLRRLSAVLCGEVRGNQALLSAEAIRALRLLAQDRPLGHPPLPGTRSLSRAVQALDRDPAVGAEALLTRSREQELRDVLAEQQRLAARRGRPVGRPVAGTWRAERSMAVDCWVARELAGRSRPEIALEQAACAARVDEAVLAIHRVLDEREHPGLHALPSEAGPFSDLT